jgi:hypothetical protein
VPLDPGWVENHIREEQPGSYFRELGNQYFGVKILKFFDADPGIETIRIRNPGWKKLRSGMEKIWIRNTV